jgi:hypothetical protein
VSRRRAASGVRFEFSGMNRMNVIEIEYRFEMDNGQCQVFNAALDSTSLRMLNTPKTLYPPWCELGFHQCPICPLDEITHCPAATNMAGLVERFDQLLSYDTTTVSVTMDERTTFSRTSVQRGICSLMGLLMAASDCPFTAFFKPMARFHLPFATTEETIWRAASIYLMAQYFLQQKGEGADLSFDGLSRIYRQIQIVNSSFAKRLRHACSRDSMINAIVLLDMFAKSMPHAIDQSLEQLRGLFTPYLARPDFNPQE